MCGCQPGKSLAKFLGFLASCMRWFTCPLRLSWTPSSTPCNFWCNHSNTQMYGCQPGKSLAKFLGFLASCMRWLTCPLRLSWTPSSTPCNFWCNRNNTRSASLFTFSWVSPEKKKKKIFIKFVFNSDHGFSVFFLFIWFDSLRLSQQL